TRRAGRSDRLPFIVLTQRYLEPPEGQDITRNEGGPRPDARLRMLTGHDPVPGAGTTAGTPPRQAVLPLLRFKAVVRRCRHPLPRADRHECRPPPLSMTSARPLSAAATATPSPSTGRCASFPCTAARS